MTRFSSVKSKIKLLSELFSPTLTLTLAVLESTELSESWNSTDFHVSHWLGDHIQPLRRLQVRG
jgi:hypothetical protein